MYTNRTSSEPSGDSCEGIERLELETQQLEHGTDVMFMSHCPSILPPPPSTLPAEFTIKPDAVRQKKFNYANPPLSVISFPTTNASKNTKPSADPSSSIATTTFSVAIKNKKKESKKSKKPKIEESSVSSSWKQTTINRNTMFPRSTKPMQQGSSSVASIANSFDDFEKPPPGAYKKVTPSPKKRTKNKQKSTKSSHATSAASSSKKKRKKPDNNNNNNEPYDYGASVDVMDHIPSGNKSDHCPPIHSIMPKPPLPKQERLYFRLTTDPRIKDFVIEDPARQCIMCGKHKGECHEVLFGEYCLVKTMKYWYETGINCDEDAATRRYKKAYNSFLNAVTYRTTRRLDTFEMYEPPPCMMQNSYDTAMKMMLWYCQMELMKQRIVNGEDEFGGE